MVPLHEPRRDDADDALVPVLAGEDVRGPALHRLWPLLDLHDRSSQDPILDGLAIPIQLLQTVRERARLLAILSQQELEGDTWMAETTGRVDSRRESETDRARVDHRGIDARHAHQRLQPRLLGASECPQPGDCQGAVLANERHHVGDGRDRNEVEVPAQHGRVGAEKRLAELVDDARAA